MQSRVVEPIQFLPEGPYVRLINNLDIYHCKAFKACLSCCISMDTHTSFSSNIE